MPANVTERHQTVLSFQCHGGVAELTNSKFKDSQNLKELSARAVADHGHPFAEQVSGTTDFCVICNAQICTLGMNLHFCQKRNSSILKDTRSR